MSTGSRATIGGLKICVVSNYYPPLFIGGYELGCRDVVEALKARGHQVKVLTSTYNVQKLQNDGEVYRWLRVGAWLTPKYLRGLATLLKKEITNLQMFRQLSSDFDPHLIYVWNPVGISLSVVSVSQELGVPVCYFVSDHWLEEWETDPGYQMWQQQQGPFHQRLVWRGALSLLSALNVLQRPLPPDLRNVQFASEYLKRQTLSKGTPISDAKVIHWGVDPQKFRFAEKSKSLERLLYVGQIVPHKGVHTAVEALKLLLQSGHVSATLTIAGGSVVPEYEAHIRQLISSWQLEQHVRFTGQVPRDRLPSIYQEHDVLVFPSTWAEPFSITVLEAMASGLPVVGTSTGGSNEILRDGVNALVFQKEDAQDCAARISRLFTDERLSEEIRQNGRVTIEQKYRIEQMVDTIERSLKEAVSGTLDQGVKPTPDSA